MSKDKHKKAMPVMLLMLAIMLLGLFFTYEGINMHNQVGTLEGEFHQMQADYFSIVKSERDAAGTDSALNQKLVEIQQAPSTLMELKLLGVGKMLTGIFTLLFGILIALIIMPVRMAQLMSKKM